MKIEKGVMVMKNGKAWGMVYQDGRCTSYGWIDPEDAPIHNPKYCTKTTDVTYENSPYIQELLTAKLVGVERRTEVIATEKASTANKCIAQYSLMTYLGERCKFCGKKYKTLEDLETTVYVGYHEHGRLACKECFENQA